MFMQQKKKYNCKFLCDYVILLLNDFQIGFLSGIKHLLINWLIS